MSYKRPALAILKLFTILFCVLLFHLIHTSETVASTAIIAPGAADSMTTEQLAVVGEILIFGRVGGFKAQSTDGKGQCALCHSFKKGEEKPWPLFINLVGIIKRAAKRIKEPRYLTPDTIQTESFPGSGRAITTEEYLAESEVCPSCYVVAGYGLKGTNDRESPMPVIHKPPVSLTIDEMIAIDTWMFINDGATPPSPQVIRAAHEKFIPEAERSREEKPARRSMAPAGTSTLLSGEVTAVDTKTKTVTVKVKDKEVKLTVTDSTNILQGKEKKSLADIQIGAKVKTAFVQEDDKMTAKSIRIVVEKKTAPAPAPDPEKK